jgi:outer membrane usher protein
MLRIIAIEGCRTNRVTNALIAALCCLSWTSIGTAATATQATTVQAAVVESRDIEELLLAVSINGQKTTDVALIMRLTATGSLLVRRDDLLRWRLVVPSTAGVMRDGELLYPLNALAGLTYRVDEPEQMLLIVAPAQLFAATQVAGSHGSLVDPTPSPFGGFLNYDVFHTSDPDRNSTNALAEVGMFNGWGMGVSNFLRQDLPEEQRIVRLETTWTHDRPAQMTSLRLGDLVNAGGSWGRPVRFGGVQWGTNFASQPGFISFSRPAMAGEATLPSTLDLYVNDTLRMRRQVPAGPFSIQDMPVMTGQGEARLVVTDLLGREQVIVAPYYASPRLLDAGLNAYSYEIGAIREDFGIASNHYGRPLAVATFRRGVSSYFTGEIHAELLENQQTAGISSVLLWPAAGVFSASMAVSRSDAAADRDGMGKLSGTIGGYGTLFAAGFQAQNHRFGYGVNAQWSSEDFAQVGLERGRPAPRLTAQAFASFAMRRAGAIGLSYTRQDPRDAERVDLLNATYNVTLGRIGFLGLSFVRVLGAQPASIASLNFTRLLGKRDTGSVFASRDGGHTRATMRVQRSLPQGEGVGYRLATGLADSDRREAAMTVQSGFGTYEAEVGQFEGETSYRGSVSGGVALLGSDAFLSRRIDSSFAVVEVPGYRNVSVYRDNQPIARTNAEGVALISRLRPYEVNSLRIEQADLPLDAKIGTLQLDAIPYLRSGLLLSFPVKRSRGATFKIVLDNGDDLPAGATVKIGGQSEAFAVGLRGEVYVTDLAAKNDLQVTWREQSCAVAVPFPESSDPLPDLGTFLCSGVTR